MYLKSHTHTHTIEVRGPENVWFTQILQNILLFVEQKKKKDSLEQQGE